MLDAIAAAEMVAQEGALDAFVERYADDPVLFADEICGIQLDEKQEEVARAVASHKLVACASAMGCGKSFVAALLAFWYLATRAWAKVVLTSAKHEQTATILSPYLRRFIAQSAIASWFDASATSVKWKGVPEAGSVIVWSWSAANTSSARGQHADEMLIVGDEASGIDDEILAQLFGTLTGLDNRMLLISNPSRVAGFFAECFNDSRWVSLHIANSESRWASSKTAEAYARRYGEDSDLYRVNVLGLFPLESFSGIIGARAIAAFVSAPPQAEPDSWSWTLGIDVGAGGDLTVWAVRHGLRVTIVKKAQTEDIRDIVKTTLDILAERPLVSRVLIDSTGVGVFVPGELRKFTKTEVLGVNFGEGSPEGDCANMRTWLYRRLGDLLYEEGAWLDGVADKELVQKSLALAEYTLDGYGRKALVPKAKIHAALGCSPDEADAIALTCGYAGDLVEMERPGGARNGNGGAWVSRAAKW